mmetsp:Transcript_32172/g.61910  ORF Transcript_32172/g.61910 Transcript_32172/m.61910 type:complete len:211 (+) Transcript_32172:272-904(+)
MIGGLRPTAAIAVVACAHKQAQDCFPMDERPCPPSHMPNSRRSQHEPDHRGGVPGWTRANGWEGGAREVASCACCRGESRRGARRASLPCEFSLYSLEAADANINANQPSLRRCRPPAVCWKCVHRPRTQSARRGTRKAGGQPECIVYLCSAGGGSGAGARQRRVLLRHGDVRVASSRTPVDGGGGPCTCHEPRRGVGARGHSREAAACS